MITLTPREQITRILFDWGTGDRDAPAKLMPVVYDELRRLARQYMQQERPDHTLQATALVHEAYLQLVDQSTVTWQNRAHFFGVAAQMMRRILVDHARSHRAGKRAVRARKYVSTKRSILRTSAPSILSRSMTRSKTSSPLINAKA